MEGGDLLLQVPLSLLLLLQLLLERVLLLILHLLQLGAQTQLLPVLLLQQLLLSDKGGKGSGPTLSEPCGPHALGGREKQAPRFRGAASKDLAGSQEVPESLGTLGRTL